MSDVAPLDPAKLIGTLHKHDVRFVLIGALAARLHGFPRLTAGADITPANDRSNVEKLAAALRELHARIYTEAVPEGLVFDCSRAMLDRATMWKLITDAGRLDIAFKPAGTEGHDDIIRSKEAAGRPKDREDVAIMRAMQKKYGTGVS